MRLRRRLVEHPFTKPDREAQLADFEVLCGELAELYASHGESVTAAVFAERAQVAGELLQNGWTQADLNNLGGQFPDGGWWLNPKAADFNAPRQSWQEEAARLYPLAKAVADDLRAIATLYPR
jgi:hypothetical protein